MIVPPVLPHTTSGKKFVNESFVFDVKFTSKHNAPCTNRRSFVHHKLKKNYLNKLVTRETVLPVKSPLFYGVLVFKVMS